ADDQNQGGQRARRFPLHALVMDNPVATALRRALVPQALRHKILRMRQIEVPSVSDAAKAYLADATRDDTAQFGHSIGVIDLTPENFKEKMLARQLSLAAETSNR
ncbi:MAG: hypothetical protein AAF788_02705, partial [Pseudomonadota bacterium]